MKRSRAERVLRHRRLQSVAGRFDDGNNSGSDTNTPPGTATRADGGLALDQRTIADRLRAVDYATGLVGSAPVRRASSTQQGFDEFRDAGSRSWSGQPAPIGRTDRCRQHTQRRVRGQRRDRPDRRRGVDAIVGTGIDHRRRLLLPAHADARPPRTMRRTDLPARHALPPPWPRSACGRTRPMPPVGIRSPFLATTRSGQRSTQDEGVALRGGLRVPAITARPAGCTVAPTPRSACSISMP